MERKVIPTSFGTQCAVYASVFVEQPEIQVSKNTKVITEINAHLRGILSPSKGCLSVYGGIVIRAKDGIPICAIINQDTYVGGWAYL